MPSSALFMRSCTGWLNELARPGAAVSLGATTLLHEAMTTSNPCVVPPDSSPSLQKPRRTPWSLKNRAKIEDLKTPTRRDYPSVRFCVASLIARIQRIARATPGALVAERS